MKIVGKLPPRPIEGAEIVGIGVVGELASGNVFRTWPAIARAGDRQTRIAFMTEFYWEATPDDWREVEEFTNSLMGGTRPEVLAEMTNPFDNPEAAQWLRTGTKPAPPRSS